jgi:metal-responsive CopG/Arc/MetJ family transcriptional regulator
MTKGLSMKKTRGSGNAMKEQSAPTVRASISFPSDLYENLEAVAKQKKVSLAWVVRDAAEKYLSEHELLSKTGAKSA